MDSLNLNLNPLSTESHSVACKKLLKTCFPIVFPTAHDVLDFNRRPELMTFKRHYFWMSPMVTDYRVHYCTLLHVQEVNLKACALVILNEIIRPRRDLNPGPTSNLLKYSAHSATMPQQGSQEQEVKFQDQIFSKFQDNFRTFLSVSRGSRHRKCTFFCAHKS